MINIKTHSIIDAFLEYDNKFLMMHRARDRKAYPDFWAAVGGGIKLNEMFEPYSACMREIQEETSILPDYIADMSLRYIITAKKKDNIRNHYVYFGKSLTMNFTDTNEGKLQWINKTDILNLKYTPYYKSLIQHYVTKAENNNYLYLGTIDDKNTLIFNILNEYYD